jgi:ATP-binding cassette subfamily B protein
LGVAAVLGVVIAVLSMATAVFSQKLIDVILPNKQLTKLWLGIGLLAVLLFAKSGIGYLRTYFLIRQSKDFNSRLMGDFYGKLLALPKLFFDTRKIGDITARINDTRRIQSVISYLVGNVVIDVLVVLISTAFVFIYSWQVGLIALSSVPFYTFLVLKYNPKIMEAQKNVMRNYAMTESHFVDTIGGVGAIKSGNRTSFFTTVGTAIYNFFQEQVFALGTIGNRYGVINEIFNGLMISSILGYCSWMVLNENLQLGEMMAILSIAVGMVGAIARLATINIQLQEAKVAFDRMYEFAALTPEAENTDNSIKLGGVKSLVIRDLSFRFAGKSQLLKRINLALQRGEMTVLVGEVGCGKSVLLQIIQRFYGFESGSITVNGTNDITDFALNDWRNQLGVMPQEIKLFSGTLLDNIILGNVAEEAERAINFCKEMGFDRYFEALPQSYATIVGEEGVNLSGGQRQLVGLARALYQNPTVLLLDEPTAAMDSKTAAFVMDLLQRLKPNLAILMITHRLDITTEIDRMYKIENGVTEILNAADYQQTKI